MAEGKGAEAKDRPWIIHPSPDAQASTPEDMYKEALKSQQMLKRLLAEINKLLEATKRFIKDTDTRSQSSPPDEATSDKQ